MAKFCKAQRIPAERNALTNALQSLQRNSKVRYEIEMPLSFRSAAPTDEGDYDMERWIQESRKQAGETTYMDDLP